MIQIVAKPAFDEAVKVAKRMLVNILVVNSKTIRSYLDQ